MRSDRSSVAAPGTCATPGRRPSQRRHRHRSAPGLPPSARFRGLGQLARVQLRTPRRSSCLLRSLHDYELRANPAILQNLRALKEQTWYPDAWVTSLGACFFDNVPCLIPDGRPTLHRSKPISLRSTPLPYGSRTPCRGWSSCRREVSSFRLPGRIEARIILSLCKTSST